MPAFAVTLAHYPQVSGSSHKAPAQVHAEVVPIWQPAATAGNLRKGGRVNACRRKRSAWRMQARRLLPLGSVRRMLRLTDPSGNT